MKKALRKLAIRFTIAPNGRNDVEPETRTYKFEEVGNDSGYGGGQYIYVTGMSPEATFDGKGISLDFRYMSDYSLKKAATAYLKDHFGDNLIKYEVVA